MLYLNPAFHAFLTKVRHLLQALLLTTASIPIMSFAAALTVSVKEPVNCPLSVGDHVTFEVKNNTLTPLREVKVSAAGGEVPCDANGCPAVMAAKSTCKFTTKITSKGELRGVVDARNTTGKHRAISLPLGVSLPLRVATFNLSFDRDSYQALVDDLAHPEGQVLNVIETIQRVRPDIILLNEFNNDGMGKNSRALDLFTGHLASLTPHGASPIHYPYIFNAPTNTGIMTGFDLNRNGKTGTEQAPDPDDAQGYGNYHGQYAFAVISRYPIQAGNIRTFQQLPWSVMRENPVITSCPADNNYTPPCIPGETWYSDEAWQTLRLSAKNHADIPITISDTHTLHFLVSHPAPPIFDNPVKHNSLHNYDEVEFWNIYIDPTRDPSKAARFCDDRFMASGKTPDASVQQTGNGRCGGIEANSFFVIAGDLNSDPEQGDGMHGAINTLFSHPMVNTRVTNGDLVAESQGGYDFAMEAPLHPPVAYPRRITNAGSKQLRLDYVIPSANYCVSATGVFWPGKDEDYRYLVIDSEGNQGKSVLSDHRPVWVDLTIK